MRLGLGLGLVLGLGACTSATPPPASSAPEAPPPAPVEAKSSPPAEATPEEMPMPRSTDAVVASLRPRFKACYQKGLNLDPKLEGKVVVEATLTSGGAVTATDIAKLEGLSDEVARCISGVVAGATFAGANVGKLMVPVTFKQQEKAKKTRGVF